MRVEVVDSLSRAVARIEDVAVRPLLEYAAAAGLPMLAHVDEQDVTTFNERQVRLVVVPELERAAAEGPPDAADAARTVLKLARVLNDMQFYLVFCGD